MNAPPAFQFYVKQWLGDDKVMLMDWATRGMHLHLICIAWQQEDHPCSIPDDDEMIRGWLMLDEKSYNVAKPKIMCAWRLKNCRWYQDGLLQCYKRLKSYSNSRSRNKRGYRKSHDNHINSPVQIIDTSYAMKMKTVDEVVVSNGKEESVREEKPIRVTAEWCEKIYQAYPKKVGRGDAIKKINAALRRLHAKGREDAAGWLLSRTIAYARIVSDNGMEMQYIPNPSTWFHQERYDDDPEILKRKKKSGSPFELTDEEKRSLEEAQTDGVEHG